MLQILDSGEYAKVTLMSIPNPGNLFLNRRHDGENPSELGILLEYGNIPHADFEMKTIKEGQSFLNIPLSLTECRKYNYVAITNAERITYYHITGMDVLNAETTRISLYEDTLNTWFPYIKGFSGQLARCHFPRYVYDNTDNKYFVNPDLYQVPSSDSFDYVDTYHLSGSSDTNWCVLILNPPSSAWYVYRNGVTASVRAYNDLDVYSNGEHINDIFEEFLKLPGGTVIDADTLSTHTFSQYATIGISTLYEGGDVTDKFSTSWIEALVAETAYRYRGNNTNNFRGYDQRVMFLVEYDRLYDFLNSDFYHNTFATWIDEIVEIPKGFKMQTMANYYLVDCYRVRWGWFSSTFASGTGTQVYTYWEKLDGVKLITDVGMLRFNYQAGTALTTLDDNPVKGLDPAYGLISDSTEIELMSVDVADETKLLLYPYDYATLNVGGIKYDFYRQNLDPDSDNSDATLGLIAYLDTDGANPVWSVSSYNDWRWCNEQGESTFEYGFAFWQSTDVPAQTFAYNYDSWSDYANYSKALDDNNLKYKEQTSVMSTVSSVVNGMVSTGAGIAQFVSTGTGLTQTATSLASSVQSVINTQMDLSNTRRQLNINRSVLTGKAPNVKGQLSSNTEFHNMLYVIRDESDNGTYPAYPDSVLVRHTLPQTDLDNYARYYDLYGYEAPYAIRRCDRDDSVWNTIFYSRNFRNAVQFEDISLVFGDGFVPDREELEDLRSRFIDGFTAIHIPLSASNLDDWSYVDVLTGFPKYANTDNGSSYSDCKAVFWRF